MHRVLSRLERYVDVSGTDAGTAGLPVVALEPGEALLGAYRNGAEVETWLLFTTHGVRYSEGPGWPLLQYREMSVVSFESKDQRWVLVQLRDGRSARLAVQGGEGKLRDALEIRRFLTRVSSDLSPR